MENQNGYWKIYRSDRNNRKLYSKANKDNANRSLLTKMWAKISESVWVEDEISRIVYWWGLFWKYKTVGFILCSIALHKKALLGIADKYLNSYGAGGF